MKHWYPRAGGATRPSHAWYWGWALYVNRRGFWGAFVRLAPLGAAVLAGALLFNRSWLVPIAALAFTSALVVLLHSILGRGA